MFQPSLTVSEGTHLEGKTHTLSRPKYVVLKLFSINSHHISNLSTQTTVLFYKYSMCLMISDYSHNSFIRFNVVLRFLWVHCISITSTKSNSGLVDWYPHGGLGPHFTTSQLKGPLEKHGLNDCCCGSWKWPGVSQQKSDKKWQRSSESAGLPSHLSIHICSYLCKDVR